MPEEKQVDPGQALKARSLKEFDEQTQGKPTPTQEENDRAAMGEHVIEKEPDGSKEQPENSGPGAGAAQPKAGRRAKAGNRRSRTAHQATRRVPRRNRNSRASPCR